MGREGEGQKSTSTLYKNLALAVIRQAIADLQLDDPGIRRSAMAFLHGTGDGYAETRDHWFRLAEIDSQMVEALDNLSVAQVRRARERVPRRGGSSVDRFAVELLGGGDSNRKYLRAIDGSWE